MNSNPVNTFGTVKELPAAAEVDKMADKIQTLPSDKESVSESEQKILTTFFTSNTTGQVIMEFKDAIVAGVLFFILSLPQVTDLVGKFSSYKSPYISILIKTCIFIIAYYVIKNLSFGTATAKSS